MREVTLELNKYSLHAATLLADIEDAGANVSYPERATQSDGATPAHLAALTTIARELPSAALVDLGGAEAAEPTKAATAPAENDRRSNRNHHLSASRSDNSPLL